MGNYAIEVLDINKKYKGLDFDRKENGIGLWIKNILKLTSNKAESVLALKKVSFNIKEGEIFGIYGSNGAGKTTLVKILSGLLNADSGTLKINGSSNNHDIKNSISYVSTNGWMGLEWQLTAKENLILYGSIFGMKPKELEKRCDEILKLTGMYENSHKFISQLSAGMRQKITIARGLLIDKPILYLDEPSVSLDVNSAIQLRSIIKKYTLKNRKTTIITSHVPDDLAICDRLMFLYKGQVIAIGTKDELYEPYRNKKVLDLKCSYFQDEYIEGIKDLAGVQNVTAYSNESGKDYRIIKISIENDQQLVNKITDLLLNKNVLLLGMSLNDISLQEIYEHYVNAITIRNQKEIQNSVGGEVVYGTN